VFLILKAYNKYYPCQKNGMKLEVLGCSGGVGGDRRAMALNVGQGILIDAGPGVDDLSLQRMVAIEHVFLTYFHLDHVAFLCDATLSLRQGPLTVHALPETIAMLKKCLFNFILWPDYSVMPSPGNPYIVFDPVEVGRKVQIGSCGVMPLSAQHSVPAVGYQLDSGRASLVYSGDTTLCAAFWKELEVIDNLTGLIIESTFLNSNADGARISGHMTPDLLGFALRQLWRNIPFMSFTWSLKGRMKPCVRLRSYMHVASGNAEAR